MELLSLVDAHAIKNLQNTANTAVSQVLSNALTQSPGEKLVEEIARWEGRSDPQREHGAVYILGVPIQTWLQL
ncbi:hypothetical protein RvY_03882 [Ramazzottius varieornatus]|uniref:Uncharacterized protein n=1 Tax=Ramazzottius varieornatus TaxID=947166 RepID=A0A1D1UVA3_RAMVA|nr:hypothetical protein RvY_03882 [Ramazzottius varieornatus]